MIPRNAAIGAAVLALAGLGAVAYYSSTARASQPAASVAPATAVPGTYLDPVAAAPAAVRRAAFAAPVAGAASCRSRSRRPRTGARRLPHSRRRRPPLLRPQAVEEAQRDDDRRVGRRRRRHRRAGGRQEGRPHWRAGRWGGRNVFYDRKTRKRVDRQ